MAPPPSLRRGRSPSKERKLDQALRTGIHGHLILSALAIEVEWELPPAAQRPCDFDASARGSSRILFFGRYRGITALYQEAHAR
jgi:hypothetical protein